MKRFCNQNKNKKTRIDGGFTLIEMSMVIIILGLAIAAILPIYNVYQENTKVNDTVSAIDTATSAIGSFRTINGRYPYPASLTDRRIIDATYGRENNADMNLTPQGAMNGAGVFIQQSIASRTMAYANEWAAFPPGSRVRVRIGFLPFKNLGLTEDQAYDSYGNRLMYAVTEHLANATTFRDDQGGIDIIDANNATMVPVPGSVHFVVFSLGKNRNGAFTQGNIRIPCTGQIIETENCDFTQTDAVFRSTDRREIGGVNAYDDIFSYFTQSDTPLWQVPVGGSPFDIMEKPGGEVGFAMGAAATNDPLTNKGTIVGTVRAQNDPDTPADEGRIMATQICSTAGNCFSTSLIAGSIAAGTGGMECPPDRPYMVGIRSGQPVCVNQIITRCPDGQIVKGVNSDGTLQCEGTPLLCPERSFSHCAPNDVTIPQGTDIQVETVTRGTSRTATYRCQVGRWEEVLPQTGSCTCTPSTASQSMGCGLGFDGNFTQTRNYTCPAGVWSAWEPPVSTSYAPNSGCLCRGAVETQIATCPSPMTGSWIQTRTLACANANSGTWSEWTPATAPPGACTCNQSTQTQMVSCGGVLTGQKRQISQSSCTNPVTWSPFVDDPDTSANTCVCTPSGPTTRIESCPPDKIGNMIYSDIVTCTGRAAGTLQSTLVSNTCRDRPLPVCTWKSNSGGQYETRARGPRKDSDCERQCGQTRSFCNLPSGNGFNNFPGCRCSI
jgi:prepilin-type N-terminal cleavage/methylation domain-containing protein